MGVIKSIILIILNETVIVAAEKRKTVFYPARIRNYWSVGDGIILPEQSSESTQGLVDGVRLFLDEHGSVNAFRPCQIYLLMRIVSKQFLKNLNIAFDFGNNLSSIYLILLDQALSVSQIMCYLFSNLSHLRLVNIFPAKIQVQEEQAELIVKFHFVFLQEIVVICSNGILVPVDFCQAQDMADFGSNGRALILGEISGIASSVLSFNIRPVCSGRSSSVRSGHSISVCSDRSSSVCSWRCVLWRFIFVVLIDHWNDRRRRNVDGGRLIVGRELGDLEDNRRRSLETFINDGCMFPDMQLGCLKTTGNHLIHFFLWAELNKTFAGI